MAKFEPFLFIIFQMSLQSNFVGVVEGGGGRERVRGENAQHPSKNAFHINKSMNQNGILSNYRRGVHFLI